MPSELSPVWVAEVTWHQQRSFPFPPFRIRRHSAAMKSSSLVLKTETPRVTQRVGFSSFAPYSAPGRREELVVSTQAVLVSLPFPLPSSPPSILLSSLPHSLPLSFLPPNISRVSPIRLALHTTYVLGPFPQEVFEILPWLQCSVAACLVISPPLFRAV